MSKNKLGKVKKIISMAGVLFSLTAGVLALPLTMQRAYAYDDDAIIDGSAPTKATFLSNVDTGVDFKDTAENFNEVYNLDGTEGRRQQAIYLGTNNSGTRTSSKLYWYIAGMENGGLVLVSTACL